MAIRNLQFGSNSAGKCALCAMIVLGLASLASPNSQTQALDAKYKHKFAEVLQEGLVTGNCSGVTFAGGDLGASGGAVVVGIQDSSTPQVFNKFQCGTQPLHKGEILSIERVRTADHGRSIWLYTATASPHSWTRGVGAFEHESHELGRTIFVFKSAIDPNDLIPKWLRVSDARDPDRLGNTASMVQVKQIKLGMSFAEVEEALGLPTTRVDLGSKVLYKYKDMTIEFHEGKVADVR